MSGKTDRPRPFSVTQDEFHQNFDAIDWGAREREKGCPRCGSTAIHACTGQPIAPWTDDDRQRLHAVMMEFDRREREDTP